MKILKNILTIHLSSISSISHVAYTLHVNDTDVNRVSKSILSFADRNGAIFVSAKDSKVFITFESYEAMMTCASWLAWLSF